MSTAGIERVDVVMRRRLRFEDTIPRARPPDTIAFLVECVPLEPGEFVVGSADHNLIRFGGKPRPLDAAQLARSHGLLPPGDYRVEIESEAHAPCHHDVVVRAGETTSLRVDLAPAAPHR